MESINGSTRYPHLSARLRDLNSQGKLMELLVGTLGAAVNVYKASKDGKEIQESFMAILLAPPKVALDKEEISGFWVALEDLLGDNVPEGHDPKNKVMFSLKVLEEFVRPSLPQTK